MGNHREYGVEMVQVIFEGLQEDDYIVDVDQCENPQKRCKYALHDSLKHAWSIAISKRHASELP